jgi:hypothetical protein
MRAMLPAFVLCISTFTAAACPPAKTSNEEIASNLLEAILARDEASIVKIANNPPLFDEVSITYMIAPVGFEFPASTPHSSAYAVLHGRKILTDIAVTKQADGSQTLEIVYLPEDVATSVAELRARGDTVEEFRDYIACQVLVAADGTTRMQHVCYAESDAL